MADAYRRKAEPSPPPEDVIVLEVSPAEAQLIRLLTSTVASNGMYARGISVVLDRLNLPSVYRIEGGIRATVFIEKV